MDVLCQKIRRKYKVLLFTDAFMSGCLLGLVLDDLIVFHSVPDELGFQIRAIAVVCMQSFWKSEKVLCPPSSLHFAAYYNSIGLLEILLEVFDHTEATSFDGSTPAQFAVVKGHLRALALLFRKFDINIYAFWGGCNTYEYLRSFSKPKESEKLPCLSRIYVYGDKNTLSLGVMHGSHSTPVPVQFFDETSVGKEVSQISCGKEHTIYLIDGRVYSCGSGRYGKLGHGDEKDQLKLRAINFSEPIMFIAAGSTHSVVCTRKKVIVFGLNDKGQLGLGTKQLILIPTVVKFFKGIQDYIVGCSTADSRSVVIMNNFDFYIAGTTSDFIWQKYSGNTFRRIKNCYSTQTSSILVTDTSIIRVFSKKNVSKATIKVNGRNYHVTSTAHVERCVGIFDTPNLGALFSSFKHDHERPYRAISSGVLLYDSDKDSMLRSVYFYDNTMERSVIEVRSVSVTRHGQIMLVDYMGDIYEGNLQNYILLSEPFMSAVANYSPLMTEQMVKVKVTRLRGILPAKSAFYTPDGRNKVLNLFEIDPRSVHHDTENELEMKHQTCNVAIVLCADENGDVLERYQTSMEMLKHESEVCSSYFERWAGEQNNEIRITAKPWMLEIFLSFCCDHHLRPHLSMQELMELLIFADKLICKNFFNAVKKELFQPPLEMSKLRELFDLARYLSSTELYGSLAKLCAAIFPTLLENGFINELSLDEIAFIEDAFQSYASENIVRTVPDIDEFDSKIGKVIVPTNIIKDIILDVMEVVKEPMGNKELIDFCKEIKDTFTKPYNPFLMMNAVNVKTNCCSQSKEFSTSKKDNGGCFQMPNVNTKIAVATNQIFENNVEPVSKNIGGGGISSSEVHLSDNSEESTPKRSWNVLKMYPHISLSNTFTDKKEKIGETKQEPSGTSKKPRGSQQTTLDAESLGATISHIKRTLEDERVLMLRIMEQLNAYREENLSLAELRRERQYEGEATAEDVSPQVEEENEHV